jgi:hypothetical protein
MKRRTPIALVTIEEHLSGSATGFLNEIAEISAIAGKTPLEVFALWVQYSDRCHDQSALAADRLGVPPVFRPPPLGIIDDGTCAKCKV